jgi:sulfur carrier protein ThiS
MKIRLEYSKFIKIEKYASASIIEAPDKCTVRELLIFLGLPVYLQKAVYTVVNDQPSWNSTVLKENDAVNLHRLLGGG